MRTAGRRVALLVSGRRRRSRQRDAHLDRCSLLDALSGGRLSRRGRHDGGCRRRRRRRRRRVALSAQHARQRRRFTVFIQIPQIVGVFVFGTVFLQQTDMNTTVRHITQHLLSETFGD